MKQQVLLSNLEKENVLVPNNDIGNLKQIIEKFVSISDLSRGKASKVIQNVVKNKDQCIIVKNNKPEAVILSLSEYLELVDIKDRLHELEEDIELMQLANERVEKYTTDKTISQEKVLEKYNIQEKEIEELMNYVEIE
jgi:prevent-host-death family protein